MLALSASLFAPISTVFAVSAAPVVMKASSVTASEPQLEQPRVYEGYAKVQLLWTYSGTGTRPDAYDVYRNNVVVAKGVEVMNYVDHNLPAGDYQYKVASVYYTTDATGNQIRRSETAFSVIYPVTIGNRNKLMETYSIDEIYNYDINESSVFANIKAAPGFYKQDLYRQGVIRDGKWFIAQRDDNNPDTTKVTDTGGGIICFDANAGSAEAMAASAKKIFSNSSYTNIGLTIDGPGNFFMRYRWGTSGGNREFTKTFKHGKLVTFANDYSSVTNEKVFANMGDTVGISSSSTTLLRYDFYSTDGGDLLNGTGKLYMTQSGSNVGKVVSFANGKITGYKNYTANTSINGSENYFYKLDGRDDMILDLRSSGVYLIKNNGTKADNVPLFTTDRHHYNIGGASVWFNNDLILIVPDTPGLKNPGNFLLAKGSPDLSKPLVEGTNKNVNAADVLLAEDKMIPILSVEQTTLPNPTIYNSRGMWYGIEKHEETGNRYFDLYLFVPGMRFAKYRIYPQLIISGEADLNLSIVYDKADGKNIDIKAVKGTVAWKPITLDTGYTLKGYTVEILNQNDQIVESHTVAADAVADTDGFLRLSTDSCLETGHSYTAQISAKYVNNLDPEWVKTSSPLLAACNPIDYETVTPTGTISVWKASTFSRSELGKKPYPEEDTYFVNYRCDIDINGATDSDEPVSYYEVWYRKANDPVGTHPNRLTNFSVLSADSPAVKEQSTLHGTYNFDAKYTDSESGDIVLRYYHQPKVDENGNLLNTYENPSNWEYYIVARYADNADNAAIKREATSACITPTFRGTTGATELTDAATIEGVNPAITHGDVTVTSPDAIDSVVIYGIDGRIAATIAGNGETALHTDLSQLAPGMYLISVNGRPAHKLVKQ